MFRDFFFQSAKATATLEVMEAVFYVGLILFVCIIGFAIYRKKYNWLCSLFWGVSVYILFCLLVIIIFVFIKARDDNKFLYMKAYPNDIETHLGYYLYRTESEPLLNELSYTISLQGKMGIADVMDCLVKSKPEFQKRCMDILEALPFIHSDLIRAHRKCEEFRKRNVCIQRLEERDCEFENGLLQEDCEKIRQKHIAQVDTLSMEVYEDLLSFYTLGMPEEQYYAAYMLKKYYLKQVPQELTVPEVPNTRMYVP